MEDNRSDEYASQLLQSWLDSGAVYWDNERQIYVSDNPFGGDNMFFGRNKSQALAITKRLMNE